MAGRAVWSRKFLVGLTMVFLLGCGIVAWRERASLLSWFYIRNLARASESNRERWVGRVANLGEAALPGLFDCLSRPDASVCANARAALDRMTQSWGGDARTTELTLRLARAFAHFSPEGQKQALDLTASWFRESNRPPDGLLSACAQLLDAAAGATNEEVQGCALKLCGILLNQPADEKSLQASKPVQQLIVAGLHAHTLDNRLLAIPLTLRPGMADLLEQVAGLLDDESPRVRRAALLSVAGAREAVHDDQLLPCLHDADAEVRRLCEQALIARGLRREYVELGRLLTDPQPATRLRVLDRLRESTELDCGLWLRRLSHDTSPSVRAAAVRAMSQQTFVDLSDRIDQMARGDDSPTVRQLADYYLNCPRRNANRPASAPSRMTPRR
jgi:hypothetical protein